MGISNFSQIVVEFDSEIEIHSMYAVIYSIQMTILDDVDHIMSKNPKEIHV